MSRINGDKPTFHRGQKHKIARPERQKQMYRLTGTATTSGATPRPVSE